jgi:hypothetical protein
MPRSAKAQRMEMGFVCHAISYVAVRDFFILFKESVVMVMDSSPLPGNKQRNTIKKIEYAAVTIFLVRLL